MKFHPALFKREEKDKPFIDLPYICVFAIATQDQILLYSTRSLHPFATIGSIHYAELTDLAWTSREHLSDSKTGSKLMACSRDGFVTLVDFDIGELGTQLTKEELPDNVSSLFDYLDIDSLKAKKEVEIKENSPTIIIPKFKSRKNNSDNLLTQQPEESKMEL